MFLIIYAALPPHQAVFSSVDVTTLHVGYRDQWFDAQMSGIKILKDDEILRPVDKKIVFQNIEWLLAFFDFLGHRKYTLTLIRDNFFW